jgi:Mrp family chromosome partitioning ATPase
MVHRHFGQRSYPGLADLLNGDVDAEQVVHQDRMTGAHAIFAGNVQRMNDDPQRIERLRPLLRTLAKHYDLVIVDSLPVLSGSEALSLASLVDRVIFVVRWGRTPRQIVLDGLQQIAEMHGKISGVVLSQVDPKRYRGYGSGPLTYPYGRGPVRLA